MQYEFAPLEGITGYIYRNAHHACFPSMDRYYTPFITPKKGKSFTTREWNDIAAEHNQNIAVVPQILTFIITVFVCIGAHITNIQYILYWFGAEAAMTFFALALGAFVAMFTGQLLAFPVYYEVFEGEAIRLQPSVPVPQNI